jgi:5-amino-6-(5-phosphoribosylamino)uracil reductase
LNLPYVILKSAVSIDGFIDDASSKRLLLSNEQDFERADQERARCDAILVGAGTIRADDPTLLVKSEERQLERVKVGLPRQPIKVTLTASGNIPTKCKFVSTGENEKIIYCRSSHADRLRSQFNDTPGVTIVAMAEIGARAVLADLHKRGIKRLLVEGGSTITTSLLGADCVDELQVSIAPFFVGESAAPRFVNPGHFPFRPDRPMTLKSAETLGHIVLLTYTLNGSVQ